MREREREGEREGEREREREREGEREGERVRELFQIKHYPTVTPQGNTYAKALY